MPKKKLHLNPYQYIIDFKNHLYDTGQFRSKKFEIPIISIGNLNTGGSGKTPFIQYLSRHYKNKKILVVAKSYKAQLESPEKVDLQRQDCVQRYGDEACLLQMTLPFVTVWSGPHKTKTVVSALLNKKEIESRMEETETKPAQKYDLIFVDDGFSHRKLLRSKDIVLIDTTRDWKHYRMLPLGRMREDWSSLTRAHAVILTKTQALLPEKKQKFINRILPFNENIFSAEYRTQLNSKNKNLFLITGIGNPASLKEDLEREGFQVVQEKIYPDHYAFPLAEQEKLLLELAKKPELQPVMTAKDLVKITLPSLKEKIALIDLEVSMTAADTEKLFEVLDV